MTPKAFIGVLFKPFEIKSFRISDYFFSDYIDIFRVLISLLSFLLLIFLVILGFIGSRDPLANPLSLFIWSIWFLIMPLVQIVFGNIWAFLNPWYGIGRLLFKNRYIFKLDNNLSLIFPSISFLLFSLFMLVDIAPDDPDRLANVVCIYFLLNFIFIWLFGMSWLDKGECFSVFFNMLSKLSWLQFRDGKALFGFFGFQLNYTSYFPPLTVMFLTIILATLSFDGLNETFFWFIVIDINPLEFHGRSNL